MLDDFWQKVPRQKYAIVQLKNHIIFHLTSLHHLLRTSPPLSLLHRCCSSSRNPSPAGPCPTRTWNANAEKAQIQLTTFFPGQLNTKFLPRWGCPRSLMAMSPDLHAGGPGLESRCRPTKVWNPNTPIPRQVAKMCQGSIFSPPPPKGAMWDGVRRRPSARDDEKKEKNITE